MNEEIDIIELLKRVKEGKAPKRISINDLEYFYEDETTFGDYYRDTEKHGKVFFSNEYDFRSMAKIANIKIKILDKPIIKKLECHNDDYTTTAPDSFEIMAKVNEIIDYINKEEK